MNKNNFRYKTDQESLVLLGDIHGKWQIIVDFCNSYSNVALVQLGDFGIGFDHPTKEFHKLKKLNQILSDSNNELIVQRGNHDRKTPDFNGKWKFDNILFADDYHILNFKDKSIQLIGGGISIDREERIIGRSWWPNEEVKFSPERVEKVDILVTHVAPTNAGLTKAETNQNVMYYHGREAMQGGDLLGDLANEQKIMQEISDLSGCSYHYFGHYHTSHFYTDPSHGRKYVGLNINEFKEIQ